MRELKKSKHTLAKLVVFFVGAGFYSFLIIRSINISISQGNGDAGIGIFILPFYATFGGFLAFISYTLILNSKGLISGNSTLATLLIVVYFLFAYYFIGI